MSPVVPIVNRTLVRASASVGVALLLSGCAARAGDAAPAPSSPESAVETPADPADGGLALQFSSVDGCADPGYAFSRLPAVSLYADGRFLTQGASPAVYPGPALPGMLLSRVDTGIVDDLVQRAVDAGLGKGSDLGAPSDPDAGWARVTVVADGRTAVTDVHFPAGCPSGESSPAGLTAQQTATWEALVELVGDLTSMGMDAASTPESTGVYEPEAVAGVVTEWEDPDDGLRHEAIPWPGPPLPGDELGPAPGVSCVTARGEAAESVMAAAETADVLTPWTDEQGRRWSVALRPLLPHERSCADLPEA